MAPEPQLQWKFEAIGTHFWIGVYQSLDAAVWQNLQATVAIVVEEFDAIWSRFRADSLVARMSQQAGEYNLSAEGRELLQLYRAYELMNAGDLATEKNDMQTAMRNYGNAELLFPANPEMKFWHAVTMVNNKMITQSLPLFKEVFNADENWAILIPRLRKVGQLNCDDETEKLILRQGTK